MAPATRRTCQVVGCTLGEDGQPYKTLEGLSTQDAVLKDLELHCGMTHPNIYLGGNRGTSRQENSDSRPDRFPRPVITDPTTDTEWQYFLEAWDTYKRATGLSGQSICDQLWHCPSDSLKKKIFNSGIRSTNSEEQILAGIRRQCVKAHNNLVNIMSFQTLQNVIWV